MSGLKAAEPRRVPRRTLVVVAVMSLVMFAGGAFPTAQSRGRFTLAEGDKVPPLVGTDLKGEATRVDYAKSSRPTVLYVITPYGPFVRKNEANLAQLIKSVGDRYDFVIVSTYEGKLQEYVDEMREAWGPSVRVVSGISKEMKAQLLLGAYPQTLVISPQGTVVRNFIGAYDEGKVGAVESFFKVKLPGMSQ